MDGDSEENIRTEITDIKSIAYGDRTIEDKRRWYELEAETRHHHPMIQSGVTNATASTVDLKSILTPYHNADIDQAVTCPFYCLLPVSDEILLRDPEISQYLQRSVGQLAATITMFIYSPIGDTTSVMPIQTRGTLLIDILREATGNALFFQDKHDLFSRSRSRPDVTIIVNNALVLKIEMKASEGELATAVQELTSKFLPSAWKSFPVTAVSGPPFCIGVAWAGYFIHISKLFYDAGPKQYFSVHHCSFNVNSKLGRVKFLQFMLKLSTWMVTVTGPRGDPFHLQPSVKTLTRNGHFVTWFWDFIQKQYMKLYNGVWDKMQHIHAQRFSHVEYGEGHVAIASGTRMCYQVNITRVGIPLTTALSKGLITKRKAIEDIQTGLSQIHSLGYAHNDLDVSNIFYDNDTNCAFLGDLEYLTGLDDPPINKNEECNQEVTDENENDKTFTAQMLDQLTLQKLIASLGPL